MIFYLFLYLIPAYLALSYFKANKSLKIINGVLFLCVFSLAIGMRWEVGGDWATYLQIMESARNVSFSNALQLNDPGYMALNWLSLKLGFDILGVNLICGAVFTWGLLVFCKKQPLPWLAFSVATPYLLIVVAMGYTRQGAALGFVMLALCCLQDKRTSFFLFYTLVGALFHKSAVVLLPLFIFCNNKG
ncbi:MAG: EpsG family protein, partial [Burkholderiales bacterium]|nr:EpsG family protein [Burkholderiales bacterium]